MEYEFIFVVDGISVDDGESVKILFDKYDAMIASHHGQSILAISRDGENSLAVAQSLIGDLRADLPGIRILRLDADLVGVSDIAARTGRTRQNVAQWVSGERGAFPPAEGAVGRSQVWRWSEVNRWLEGIGLGDGAVRPSRDESLMIDLVISQWLQAMDNGVLAIQLVVQQDDRIADRQAVMNMLTMALQKPGAMEKIQSLPRKDAHRLKIVCAVLLDPLASVLAQIGSDEVSAALAVVSGEGNLHLTMVASMPLPGTVSASSIGLGGDATVGDLVLLQVNGTVDFDTPLSLV